MTVSDLALIQLRHKYDVESPCLDGVKTLCDSTHCGNKVRGSLVTLSIAEA